MAPGRPGEEEEEKEDEDLRAPPVELLGRGSIWPAVVTPAGNICPGPPSKRLGTVGGGASWGPWPPRGASGKN